MTQLSDTLELKRPVIRSGGRITVLKISWVNLFLLGILILAAALRLVNAAAFGSGNTYYTAAVQNMLLSPSNFFYAVADAGGVTVDKPPVALWIQAIFGAVLGVNGFTVTLPSILAGVLSVGLLYHLVKKSFGSTAGLIAALVLAVMPVSVAIDRTNNLDSILIFTMLLAAWAFIRATETCKWRHLLLGAVLVGVGFNVKMLQAYLALPAFLGLYFLGAAVGWRRKIGQLVVTLALTLAVSFSWAVIVDLTPADQRPYVGGSQTNSVIELALGYNGLQRLLGIQFGSASSLDGGRDDGNAAPPVNVGGPGGAGETGNPGVLRLFTQPLSNELSWLLPFGLFSIGLLALSKRVRLPLSHQHQAVILWGGWLMTGIVYFSVSRFFHAYYLATLAPPLAALVGIGAVRLWHGWQGYRLGAFALTLVAIVGTLGFQLYTVGTYGVSYDWQLVLISAALAGGMILALISLRRRESHWRTAALVALIAAILFTPMYWGASTALSGTVNSVLPTAYAGTLTGFGNGRMMGMTQPPMAAPASAAENNADSTSLISYLKQNQGTEKYLLAVGSSMMGGSLSLQAGIPVLYLGGFSGSDPIYTAERIAQLIADGELRYILTGGMGVMGGSGQSEINTWVTGHCTAVKGISLNGIMDGGFAAIGAGGVPPSQMTPPSGMTPPSATTGAPPLAGMIGRLMGGTNSLYDCRAS